MKQENPYRYSVDIGEEVTIAVTPMDGASGERVTAAVDADVLENKGEPAKPVFKFTAKKASKERHFVKMSFSFIPGNQNSANFEVRFEGSNGGSFPGNTIRKKEGELQEPEYTFKVN